MTLSIRRIVPYGPDDIVNGPVGEWILITLLCVLFMSIAGVALPSRLTQSKYGRVLIGALGLSLGFALYRARRLLHFNFEAFGFVGYVAVILIFGLMFYGLSRLGMDKNTAFPLTYCVMFFSLSVMSPSIFDMIAKTLPILNLIALGCFFWLLGKLVMNMIPKRSRLDKEMRHLEKGHIHQNDERKIDKEIKEEAAEEHDIERYLAPLTNQGVHSVEELEIALKNVLSFLGRNPSIGESSKRGVVEYLKKIAAAKRTFLEKLKKLRDGLERNQKYDERQLHELRTRMKKTKDKRKKTAIQKEWLAEKKKLDVFDFIFSNEKTITREMDEFESCLSHAAHEVAGNNTPQAVVWIKKSHQKLMEVGSKLRRILHFEAYLHKAAKHAEKVMKNERNGRQI